MLSNENDTRRTTPGVLATSDVLLVADECASAVGEALAASALTAWRLPLHPTARRLRDLVSGAVSATSPLQRLHARLVLLPSTVLLEVVFLDTKPGDYDPVLLPDGAEWGWRHNRAAGTWSLCDHIDLRPLLAIESSWRGRSS